MCIFLNSLARNMQFKKDNHLHHEVERAKEKVLIYGVDKYECLSSTLDAQFPAKIHKV